MTHVFFEMLGRRIIAACAGAGMMVILFVQSLRDCRFALQKPQRLIIQMKRIGNDTLFIAAALSLFIGMVLALHSGYTLRKFDFQQALATIVALSIVKEMAPVISGLLLAGRIGASITAEIGSMQVNEEIDALHTLGISPIRYLAMPRFIGCVTMLPVLVIYASLVGIAGGAIVANAYFGMSYHNYFDTAFRTMRLADVVEGQVKAFTFGALVAVIACHYGFATRGGAEGLGRSITTSVVTSFIAIIIGDYFITRFMM